MQNFHHLLQISFPLSFIGDYITKKQGERLEKHTHTNLDDKIDLLVRENEIEVVIFIMARRGE